MFMYPVFTVTLFTSMIYSMQNGVQFTEEDLTVIRRFIKSLHINHLVVITDEKHYNVLNFLKQNLYCAVLGSGQLYEVLNSKKDFFATSTMVVSKENLNYTVIFQKLLGKATPAWVTFSNSLDPLQHFYIPMNADFYAVQYTPRAVIINRAFHIKPGLNVTLNQMGVWQRESADIITVNKSRTYDFNGLSMGMLHFLDEECKASRLMQMLDRIECFHQEILNVLANKLNYRIRLVECPEKNYPYNYPNGTLSSLFTLLNAKEVDFSSASYIISKDRLNKYDYSWPIFTSRSMLYIKARKQSVWKGYLRPIHKYLWHAICVWIMVVGLLIQFFQECRGKRFKPRFSLLSDLIKSVFTSLQVFCNQGLHDVPEWYSTRILFIVSFILFVIFYQAYSGFLISFLMIDVPNIPFTDINGFFLNEKYKILSINKGFHHYITSKLINDLKRDEEKFKLPFEQLPKTIDKGIEKLCNSKRLTYVEFRENIVMYEIPCKIIELPHPILYQSIGIGFPKHSPYREPIHQGVVTLNSAGIIQRMKVQLFSYVNLKEKEISTEEYTKVSFKHVVSVFFILAVGTAFALALLLLEILSFLSLKLHRKFKKRFIVPKPQINSKRGFYRP